MGDKVGENPAALRVAVFLLSAKNRRGGVHTIFATANAYTDKNDWIL